MGRWKYVTSFCPDTFNIVIPVLTVFSSIVIVLLMSGNELKERVEEIEALVVSSQNGDQAAFASLYDIFIDHIYRYVYYRVGSDDAEDIVETVFLKVWEKINQYQKKPNRNFSAWIFRIAHNLVVDYYRTASERQTEELGLNLPDQTREHNPIRVTQDVLDKNVLKTALSRLKRKYRDVLVYKFINDLSNSEISEIIRKSEGSVRILQFRALKALKKILQDQGIKY